MAKEILARHKKAFADYEILEKFETGMVLEGPEVKSIRGHNLNLKGSFVDIDKDGIVWSNGVHVSPYKFAKEQNLDPTRKRQLLLRKREIEKIQKQLNEKGVTCTPLSVYLRKGLIKMQIGIVRGKKKYDRRNELKQRSQNIDIARALKHL